MNPGAGTHHGEAGGIVPPTRRDYAVSTDAALAEPDEVVTHLDERLAWMDGAAPPITP